MHSGGEVAAAARVLEQVLADGQWADLHVVLARVVVAEGGR